MIGLARLSILATSALLAGCATSGTLDVSDPKAGFTAVAGRTTSVTGQQPVWIQSNAEAQATADKIRSLVRGKTIDADLAVKVALLNNKGLQAAYADIGTSAAELW